MSIQSTIEASAAALSPSLRRIAAAVLERPQVVLESTINQLAESCATSVTSVVRFCQAIGLSGYAQLRVVLATELGKQEAQFGSSEQGSEISPTDTLEQTTHKISTLELMAIDETLSTIDFTVMERVIDRIESASRILLFGIGASAFVAEDLQHKLFRIGREAFSFRDPHEAWSAAALPIGGAVAVAMSHSGETAETLKFLHIAKDNGAFTVGLTGVPGSSLALSAEAVLVTKVRESTFRAGAMVSRIAQLALIDCLFIGVAQRRYRFTVDALRRTREVTRRP